MKHKIIVSIGVVLFVVNKLLAQSPEDPAVKILPTAQAGIVKVLFARELNQPLKVEFITEEGMIFTDKIKGGSYPKGLSKRYDVRYLDSKIYWVKISTSHLSVTYRVAVLGNGMAFEPQLESTTYNNIPTKGE
ncbi:MAG: hypothetical protein ACOYXT_00170 [Bacteroidota bacterium]